VAGAPNREEDLFCQAARPFAAGGLGGAGAGEEEQQNELARLRRLAEVALPELKADLQRLVNFESATRLMPPPKMADQKVAIKRIGNRVGLKIERHCAIQLPGVRPHE
jgi:hypothetical protein